MHKVVRNTLFTATVLGLTSLGVAWNKDIATRRQPLAVEQVALAAQSNNDPSLPVSITTDADSVILGQSVHVAVQTVAGAKLEIATRRPDGSAEPTGTLQATADRTGRYTFTLTESDYHYIGMFSIAVVSSANGTSNQAAGAFTLVASPTGGPVPTDHKIPFIP